MPSRRRSLAYSKSPFTLGTPSTRRTDSPMPPLRRVSMLIRDPRPNPDELAVAYDGLALYEEGLHRSGAAEDQRGDGSRFRAAMRQVVDVEQRGVRALANFYRPDVISSKAGGSAGSRNPQCLACRHRGGAL